MPKAGSTAAKANSAFWAKALGGDVAQDHDTDECLWDAGWEALA
jgi:G:T-mismatch repair DNA endonuclease (very short patch repair protein)